MCKPLSAVPPQGYYPVPVRTPQGRTLGWIVLAERRDNRGIVSFSQLADEDGRVQIYRGPTAAIRAAHIVDTNLLRAENARLRALSKQAPVAEAQPSSVFA